MALILHSSSTLLSKYPHLLLHKTHLQSLSKPTKFSINSLDSSSEPPISGQPSNDTLSTLAPPPKKPNSTGLGFGSSSNPNPAITQKGKRERASVIRRTPVETPKFISQQEENKLNEQGKDESAFLLTWLGLGSIIFVQGILLAVSGFLPEELDNLCVKYVYPSFTPTVVFFFGGTVAYGLSKYLQNEKTDSDIL